MRHDVARQRSCPHRHRRRPVHRRGDRRQALATQVAIPFDNGSATMDLIEVDIFLDWILWCINVGAALTVAVVVWRRQGRAVGSRHGRHRIYRIEYLAYWSAASFVAAIVAMNWRD